MQNVFSAMWSVGGLSMKQGVSFPTDSYDAECRMPHVPDSGGAPASLSLLRCFGTKYHLCSPRYLE